MSENENKKSSIFFRLFQYILTIFSRRIDIKGNANGNIIAGDRNIIGDGNIINIQTSIKIILPFFIITYAVICFIASTKFDAQNDKNKQQVIDLKSKLETAILVKNIDDFRKRLIQIPSLQKEMLLPTEPKFSNPISVYNSLFSEKIKNEKLINELKEEIVKWKENLDEIDIHGVDLSGVNMSDAKLRNANLSDSDLRNVDLSNSDLRNISLINADLRGANLNNADLQDAILWNAKFHQSDFSDKPANLSEAKLHRAKLNDAKLQGVDLYAAELIDTVMISADLSGANLNKADLSGANLSGAIFYEASLIEVNLNKAKEWSVQQINTANICDRIRCGDDEECKEKIKKVENKESQILLNNSKNPDDKML